MLRTGVAGRSRTPGRSWLGPCAEPSVNTAATATAASPATLTAARADRLPARRWHRSRSLSARREPFAARPGSPSAAEWTAASKTPWVGARSDSCPFGSLRCTGAAKMLGRSAATAGAGLSKEFAIASTHEEEVAAKLAPSPQIHTENGPAPVAGTARRAGAGRRRRRRRRPPAARTDLAASPARRNLRLLSAGEDHAPSRRLRERPPEPPPSEPQIGALAPGASTSAAAAARGRNERARAYGWSRRSAPRPRPSGLASRTAG